MRRRAGRRRKVGRRKPSADLVSAPRPMPAQIAARMPHRRALEEKALISLAEKRKLGPSWRLRRARAGAGDRRGGLCAALAGVHREPLCSQSLCSVPAPRAAGRWAGADSEDAVFALNAYFSTHCRRYPQG
jgi:hypothetical protein